MNIGSKADQGIEAASRAAPSPLDGVMASLPEYMDTPETKVVDLAPDGVDCIPVLGEHNYKRFGGSTVPHVHPGMIEMMCCRRGANLSFDCDGEIIPFRPGMMFVAQPETPHFLRRYPKGLSTVWIWFRMPERGRTILGLSGDETAWLVKRLRTLPVKFEATEPLRASFRRLWSLYREPARPAPARRLLLRDAATRLLLDIAESADERSDYERSNAKLLALIDEIRRSPSLDCSVDDLAERAAMSVANLTACFRRETGLPPHSFIIFCRIAAAKELLATTQRSVGAIANELGFPSAQHFATQFRRETGMTPLAWRCRR